MSPLETVYIVIPIYNEADNLPPLMRALIPQLSGREKILMIDDGSRDASPRVITALGERLPIITPILREEHQGYARILRQAFAAVPAGQWIVTLMADGSDDVTALPDMYRAAAPGVDMVCASRYMRGGSRTGGSLLKAAGSRFLNLALQKFLSLPSHDATNSFKLFRRDLLDAVALESQSFDIFMELLLKACAHGCRIVEIPTRWHERCRGKSHFSALRNGIPYVWNGVRWACRAGKGAGRP